MRVENMTTLCYIEQNESYLMLHRVKRENDMNKEKWLGIGGHFEEGESPEECVNREVREETGLELLSLKYRGFVTFISEKYGTEYMHLFTSDEFCGEMTSCDEGDLLWVKKREIQDLNIWEGDKIFLKLFEENYPFFSLKLKYREDKLVEAVLDGKQMNIWYQTGPY